MYAHVKLAVSYVGGASCMNKAEVLSKTLLFKSMPRKEIDKLALIAQEVHLPAGSDLFQEGEMGDALFVIVMGTVRVEKSAAGGNGEEMAMLGSASCFGEMALILDDHLRATTVTAVESTVLLEFSRESIHTLCHQDPTFASAFYLAVAKSLARRLRMSTTHASFYKELAARKAM
jgi:CRP/FNR family cyclic AMP-dependent transcriptional regulator